MDFPIGAGSPVPLHFLAESLGFLLGYRYYAALRRRRGDAISDGNRLLLFIGMCVGAFAGSRLLGALENPADWRAAPHPVLYLLQAKTIVGGLFGGLLGVEGVKLWIGERQSSGDLLVFPLLLGIALGRLGCFTMGVHEPTYGLPTCSVFGMDLGDGIPRHPVVLYELAGLAILAAGMHALERTGTLRSGVLFKLFMLSYFGMRFGLEFLKPRVPVLGMLGTLQIACLLLWAYYLPTLWRLVTRPHHFLASHGLR